MNDPVDAALAAAFPDRAVVGLSGVGPSWNGANDTVGVDFADGGRAYLKVALDDDGTRIARESAVLSYVAARRPLTVPRVLAAEPDGPVPYLATAPVPGRDLLAASERADDDRREALLRRVGATLATLHAERFADHAEIVGRAASRAGADSESADADDVALALEPADWTDVLLATIERTREIATSDRLADHFAAVIDCVESNRALLNEAPAALLHGDVAKPNAFVVDDAASADPGIALIDWELAHVGDPARDLVRARDQLCNGFDEDGPARLGDAVYEGYRARAGGLPAGFAAREPIYRVVRVLGRSGFVDQWTTHIDEPLDRLVERADAELDARLAAASASGSETER